MFENSEDLKLIRHSMAHVMASAVLDLFPTAKIAIGPAIEEGFYYDFDLPRQLTDEDLPKIEEGMRKLIGQNAPFTRKEVSRDEAKKLFKGQIYKEELIDSIPQGETVSIYTVGKFTDLCRGPHVEGTKKLNPKAFKLLSIAGAYWRGDEKNKMLTRIYATAWEDEKTLNAYLEHLEDIQKRDHRKIGKDLDLFSTHEEAGPGLIYWHPKGARIRHQIETFWKEEHYKNGYELVYTPHVGKAWLWQTSGHLDFYKESMYSPMEMDKSDYYVKPMNCPFAIMIYKNSKHSYRDLPYRWAELGTVYRYEKAGSLHGLLRVRGFTQDDAHIFCTPEQMLGEVIEVLRFSLHILHSFGFTEIKAYLSTKPEKSVGEKKLWDDAQSSLEKAIKQEGLSYDIDEGGGAFYGPKIDLKIKDALGREWQLSTVQFDFNLPERFGLVYTDKDGVEKRPYMIHRALLGSIERFFGVLTEHYGGSFPVWLSPEQVKIVPVAPAFNKEAKKLESNLIKKGIRASADLSDERMNAKIRLSSSQKIPYTIVLGEKEIKEKAVSIRVFGEQKARPSISLSEFVKRIQKVINDKKVAGEI